MNYREALVKRLEAQKPCTVLDAGTGAGVMTKALSTSARGFCVVSTDVNKRVFRYVLEGVNKDRTHFVACDFAHLPFKENAFCCVVCDLVISTSREWKPFSTYAEFRRVLKTGSSLFVTDYYPEKSPRTKEALFASETSALCRAVLSAKELGIRHDVPPQRSVRQLRKVGFKATKMKRIKANEAQEWKRRVFDEYFRGMEMEISSLCDCELKTRFMQKLKLLKSEIERNGRARWEWGSNYLVEATK